MSSTVTSTQNRCAGNDIVIDVTVMSKYGFANDPKIKTLFEWLAASGCLRTNEKLIGKYIGSCNLLIAGLLGKLLKDGRHKPIPTAQMKNFRMPRFKFTCGEEDRWHTKTVLLSERKKLVSFDKNFLGDINAFPKVDGVKPEATKSPEPTFYE